MPNKQVENGVVQFLHFINIFQILFNLNYKNFNSNLQTVSCTCAHGNTSLAIKTFQIMVFI